ncbi:uncharacterized protein N7482_005325 [Penicillium canariense]|uniref:Uncharacterized protein n=1 Tax=Penicillium canariense TaxID=189055 RepID=A0A9W9I275_9EURO|nr:uncharacterized protein N7482_005325 [Penicillium canariense]KAJ5166544.1 hypothetical protein N7482_005325 [Penicillium canariense]
MIHNGNTNSWLLFDFGRSFLGKFLLYGTAFHLWSSFVLVRFDDDDTQDDDPAPKARLEDTGLHRASGGDKQLTEGALEEDEPVFIPLTWSRLQEGDLYTASDPEWQEFVKIAKDRKKLQNLRDELATIVLESASDRMSQILGSPLSLTGFWLVHQFPPRAPPGYLRSGYASLSTPYGSPTDVAANSLEIADDGVSWVTRPLDPDVGDRLQTFMKPVHVALAIKDAYVILIKRQWARLRDPNTQPVDALELLSGSYILSGNEKLNPISPRQQPKLPPPLSDGPPENILPDDDPELHPSSIISSLQRLPLPDLGPGSDLHLASVAFKLRLNEYRVRSPRTPRRGTFFVSGPVGLKGPNGFCRFEVCGEYDPVKSAWRTVEMKLKDINPRRQKALGGQ